MAILGPPYCGIDATIRIGREMLCLPYAGFFLVEIWSLSILISFETQNALKTVQHSRTVWVWQRRKTRGGRGSQTDRLNKLITTMFVEQPLALPGSAK